MTLPPKPPELRSPWRTDRRAALQTAARDFAHEQVLPAAGELDPVKGELPPGLLAGMASRAGSASCCPRSRAGWGSASSSTAWCRRSSPAWLSAGSILARGQGLGTQVEDDARREQLLRRSARSWTSTACACPTATA